jgi:ABC-type branched-subunit amino acid transport system substrate-binding protein
MRKVTLFLLVALLLSLAGPALAQDEMTFPDFIQHSECTQDLTGETITVYHFGDISGPFAFITQPLLAGLGDAIAYYNERGGICGATIAADNRDTGGDLAQSQAHYDYYSSLEDKPDLILLYASADAELLRQQVAEDEIPALISAGSVAGLYGEDGMGGWIYATNPLYVDQFGAFCEFLAANGEMFPEPVVGYMSWAGAFGEAAYQDESIAYCASLGVTVLDTPEYFLPSATDISTQVQNLVDAGANILYTNSLASGPFLVGKTLVDLGLEDDVQLAGVNWALDTSVGLLSRASIGSDGLPAVNGIIGSLPFRWWSEVEHPGIALIREQAEANERGLPVQNISYILGWSIVDMYTELYIQAIAAAGSLDAVDGNVIKTTLESMVYSPLGLYNVDFQGGAIRALPDNRMAQMYFLNATMDGPATSGDDALKIPQEDGTNIFVPLVVPLADFAPAPDLRPGGASVPQE